MQWLTFASLLRPSRTRAVLLATALCTTAVHHAQAQQAAPQANGSPDSPEASAEAAFRDDNDGPRESSSLEQGTIHVRVVDADKRPVPRAEVTLGIVYNSVAKGESRKRVVATTNESGTALFSNLDTGSEVAYRPTFQQDGATFASTPFRLGDHGIEATIQTFPVTRDLAKTIIASQSIAYIEVKDDRIQIEQAFNFYNFGKNAWVPPTDFVIPLPDKFTAFATQNDMSDVGVDAVAGRGVKLHGTFTPGQHSVEFRWQLPYAGASEIEVAFGASPRMAAARVIAVASKQMTLTVDGFDPATPTTSNAGQRLLISEKQLRRSDTPMPSVNVAIRGLPSAGAGRLIASVVAFAVVAAGVAFGRRPRHSDGRQSDERRRQVLADLAELTRARRDGAVGPQSHEQAYRELMDELAQTFALEAVSKSQTKRRAASAA